MKVSKACLAKFESVARISTVSRVHVHPHLQLTRLPDAEKLVRVPTDDAAGQSAPAPFQDAAQSLRVSALSQQCSGGKKGSYQWRCEAQFLGQSLACELSAAFVVGFEEVAHKVARGAGFGCGSEG